MKTEILKPIYTLGRLIAITILHPETNQPIVNAYDVVTYIMVDAMVDNGVDNITVFVA